MQPRGDGAEDAARLVVAARARHGGERFSVDGALYEESIALMREDAGGADAIPPRHQAGAEALLRLESDLQHGGRAVPAHGQEAAAMGDDDVPVPDEAPAPKLVVETQSASPMRRRTPHCSRTALVSPRTKWRALSPS